MTGKADAVRAVSQQFKDRTNAVIEGVMAHLRDDNAKEILGSGLSPLIGRGSLKSIVTFALYADVLRMVRDMVMADGEISAEEVQESLGLLSVLAGGFAKVRSKEYSAFAQLSLGNARQFLAQYESDAGLFGYANEATHWAGVELCRNIQDHCGDSEPLEAFGSSLLAWAEELSSSDGVAANEQAVLDSLRKYTAVQGLGTGENSKDNNMTSEHVLTKEIAEQFCSSDSEVDLTKYTTITDEAAEVLGASDGSGYAGPNICLDGIEHLSEVAAKCLFRFEGALTLSSLKSLSLTPEGLGDAMQSLTGSWKGRSLILGLTEISDVTAAALASIRGSLCLDQVQTLSDSAAACLAKHVGGLSLEGIEVESVSDNAARLLCRMKDLDCSNFVDLYSPGTVALTFRSRHGHLVVEPCTDDVDQLAKHAAVLKDSWVVDVSDLSEEAVSSEETMQALATLPCRIKFGCIAIRPSLAQHLAAFAASALDLRECERLSTDVANELSRFNGDILLKLHVQDEEVQRILKAHPSLAKWGVWKGPYVDLVCKNCGDHRQLEFPDVDSTVESVFGDGPGPWAICPECREELSEEELLALED